MDVQQAVSIMKLSEMLSEMLSEKLSETDSHMEFDSTMIKRQYRKLALQCHPDKCGGDSTQFHKLCEAYNLLCDTPMDSIKKYVKRDAKNDAKNNAKKDMRSDDQDDQFMTDLMEIPDNIIELVNSMSTVSIAKSGTSHKDTLTYRLAVNIDELHLKEKCVLYKQSDSTVRLTVSLLQMNTLIRNSDNTDLLFTIVKGDITLPKGMVFVSSSPEGTATTRGSPEGTTTSLFRYTVKLKSLKELILFDRKVPFPDGSTKRVTISDLYGKLLKAGTDTLYIGDSGVPYWYMTQQDNNTIVPLYIQFRVE